MADIKNIRLTDFIQGLQEEDTLDYPNNAVRAGSNVTPAETIQTRGGLTACGATGLPANSDIIALSQVKFPTNETTYIIAQVQDGTSYYLYASYTTLPSTTMSWTKIWDYTSAPGKMSVAVLGDRAIITDGQADPPLVFSGCMQNTQVDWAYPKNVINTQDGARFYDVSPYVLDQDIDVAADIGGIRSSGYIAVCTDLPKVDAFYVEMGTANTGLSGDQLNFTADVDLSDTDNITREDLSGNIDYWYQDSGLTGHFEAAAKAISGDAVDNGDGTVTLTCTGHGLINDDYVRIYGTTNYNNARVQITKVNDNSFKFTSAYVAETGMSGNVRKRLPITTSDPLVISGIQVIIGGATYHINTITNTGENTGEVALFSAATSGTVTYAYGVQEVNSAITVSYGSGNVDSFGPLTDDGASGFDYVHVRQVVTAADFSTSGSAFTITFQAADSSFIPTSITGTKTLKMDYVSIGIRSGTTSSTTTTPTEITFNGGQHGFEIAAGASITSDVISYAIDHTKSYLVCMDINGINYSPSTYVPPSGNWGLTSG